MFSSQSTNFEAAELIYCVLYNPDSTGAPQLHILSECVISFQVALGTPRGSIFTDKFSSIIHRLKEAGLIDKWIRDKMYEVERKSIAKAMAEGGGASEGGASGEKAWTIKQLEAPFIICGLLMSMAVVSFSVEVFIVHLVPADPKRELKHQLIS